MGTSDKNRFRTDLWKADSALSVDFYNDWFMSSAPETYKAARTGVLNKVLCAIRNLDFLKDINCQSILNHPEYISVLRACTAPPLAIDRLAGLSKTSRNVITNLDKGRLPKRMTESELRHAISSMKAVISKLLDTDIFPWLEENIRPTSQMVNRSASIVADRITGTLADPVIRNSQEIRQLAAIDDYLISRGYRQIKSADLQSLCTMPVKTFAHHINVPVEIGTGNRINMPIDVVIKPENSKNKLPLFVECKSAGDFANTSKRRKEEAIKVSQLRHTYGKDSVIFILFLCGYFDSSYLGYEASENIDWVWEHRISDFSQFGI